MAGGSCWDALLVLLLLQLYEHRGLDGSVVHLGANRGAERVLDRHAGTSIASAAMLVQRSSPLYSSGGIFSVTGSGVVAVAAFGCWWR
jgi:hypothetical protein